jgi:hypothetical protein
MGMKAVHVLKHVDFKSMTKADKAALKKNLNEHKAELKKAMDAVNKGLKELAKK